MSQHKIYAPGVKLGDVVHSEGKADPNASHSTTMVEAPKIEAHLKRGVVEIDGDAAEHLLAYGDGMSAKDKAVATAYQAIQEGRQLIDLRKSIIKAWRDRHSVHDWLDNVPPVALTRGDLSGTLVTCRSTANQNIEYVAGAGTFRRPTWNLKFEALRTGVWGDSNRKLIREGRTRAPHVPPYIATRIGDLAGKLLFWEASWVYSERYAVQPRTTDPALLEHVAGDLYAVVATWELSALEAAALGGS